MRVTSRSVAWLASAAAHSLLPLLFMSAATADEPAAPVAGAVTTASPGTALSIAADAALAGAQRIAPTTPAPAELPRIAIIIDDLGYRSAEGFRAARLPGPVAVAILPHTTYADVLAREAASFGKEIVLHVPMQALEAAEALGPGALYLGQTRAELATVLADDLAAVPLARAVSNHMGSSLTREPQRMRWIMEELRSRGSLLFIDSYTTADSVALQVASDVGLPALRRDVFLDGAEAPEAIEHEWRRLVARAHERGFALGIGHPRAATLELLERVLHDLAPEGVELVSLATLLRAERAAMEAR
jgi:polysaccharide deacetylase 2 family uncharacterized protein YibQ